MHIHSAMLMTDWLIWFLVLIATVAAFWMRKNPQLRTPWRQIFQRKMSMIAFIILCFYVVVGLLDCIHFRVTHTHQPPQIKSVLDQVLGNIADEQEKTYSKPFAKHLYSQTLITLPNGKEVRAYPRLKYKTKGFIFLTIIGFSISAFSFILFSALLIQWISYKNKNTFKQQLVQILRGKTLFAWRECLLTVGIVWILIGVALALSMNYHLFGTDKIGQDVFYQTIKSIRTGLIIGTLTTLFMLPFALILGTMAGYFGGWIDDIIQYLYTTLSSIPGVLLISASILVLQVYINNHPHIFPTLIQRADARLLALCFILGITSWASLCRLLRGETLKLRELDFIAAAKSLGVNNKKILTRHIFPNVIHIIIITLVLDFSTLVLAEAVLSYVGVGVDPTTLSWGNMINSSRLELAREPMVWWPLLAALIFMFLLVLAANVFADSVRDALDPRLRELE